MNEAMYTGNLGADLRSVTLQNGTNVCDFNVAVNRRYTTNGQQVEETVWVKVTAWRNLAQTCARFLSKGSKVLVNGRMEQPELFQGRDGHERRVPVDRQRRCRQPGAGRGDGGGIDRPNLPRSVRSFVHLRCAKVIN